MRIRRNRGIRQAGDDDSFKYGNLYGAPDGGLGDALLAYHRHQRENILMGSGSGEILISPHGVPDRSRKDGRRCQPRIATSSTGHQHPSQIDPHSAVCGFRQDIPSIIKNVKRHYRDIGLVYICNPNNPTGMIIPKQEIASCSTGCRSMCRY